MNVFKRVEVWVLLLLMAGGLVFVFMNPGQDTPGPGGGSGGPDGNADAPPAATAFFTITEIRAKRDYDNVLVELTVDIDNRQGGELELISPHAQLLAGPGEESTRPVEAFFLAFAPPATVPAGRRESAELRYWLEPGDLDGGLWLRLRDETRPVKNPGAAFDLASIENQATVRFSGSAWTDPRSVKE